MKAPLHKYVTGDGERRVRVQADGLPSHTVFNLIERWPEYALVEAELKTGRTHQIRVHLASIGTADRRRRQVRRLRAEQGSGARQREAVRSNACFCTHTG